MKYVMAASHASYIKSDVIESYREWISSVKATLDPMSTRKIPIPLSIITFKRSFAISIFIVKFLIFILAIVIDKISYCWDLQNLGYQPKKAENQIMIWPNDAGGKASSLISQVSVNLLTEQLLSSLLASFVSVEENS